MSQEKTTLTSYDYTLDITNDVCPITFVRTKLRLEKMRSGQRLLVMLRGGEALKNVPRSVIETGHEVVSCTAMPYGTPEDLYHLIIQKNN